MAMEEPAETWEEDTWDNLIPRLHDRCATRQAGIEQAKREYPDDDFSVWDDDPVFKGWLWLPAVAEAMRSRPELLAYRPMLSHAIIRLPHNDADLWVQATANDHFTVKCAVHVSTGSWSVTPIGEGNAEQTAECVAAYLKQCANKE